MLTAQAYITTDLDDNQITAFHPGAMNEAHRNPCRAAREVGLKLGIVSPDGRQGMLEHAAQLHAAGIPFMFDPGQGLPMFDGDDLRHFIERATWVAVNDYEAKLLVDRTGWSEEQVAGKVRALIVTRGARAPRSGPAASASRFPPVKPRAVLDPTGCGDAYRAGLLHGICPRPALGRYRPPRVPAGRAQDRPQGHPEPPLHASLARQGIPRGIRA